MQEINTHVQDTYYAEAAIQLRKAGFAPQSQEDGLLPVDWGGSHLCRITAGGGAQFRAEDLERDGARAAFDRAVEIAASTAEYMRLLESAPELRAEALESGYKLLSEFNGVVLATKPNERFGCQFVTWERTYDQMGVTLGHYTDSYQGAKRDFAVRAGLIPQAMVFSERQLADLCRCCQQALASPDSTFSYRDAQRIGDIQEQIERLSPGAMKRAEAMELPQQQQRQQQTQTMY